MRAAIYARKSTKQEDTADGLGSCERQIESARVYAASKGWDVLDDHIYVDDGISGAEFDERRPGLLRLLNALKPTPPFDVLVMAEDSRLGRDQIKTAYTFLQIVEAGVDIWFYLDDQQLRMDGSLDTLIASLKAFASEMERQKARQRTKDALVQRAKRGHAAGGVKFGYDRVATTAGTEWRVNAEQAPVVRYVCERYVAGDGYKKLAGDLTRTGAPAPHSKAVGWSPSAVRELLTRKVYIGSLEYNKTQKRNTRGAKFSRAKARPETEWIVVERPELRIVSDDLWQKVQARRKEMADKTVRVGGMLMGRPAKTVPNNLLSGFATCGVCGGSMVVETSARKGRRQAQYVCSKRRLNGSCTNALRVDVAELNEAVLHAIEEHALTPESVERVVAFHEQTTAVSRRTVLEAELKTLERRIGVLVNAIEAGGDAVALVAKLRTLEADKGRVEREMLAHLPLPRLAPRVVADRLAEWRQQLRDNVARGRAVLQRVVDGRIVFWPEGDSYRFEARTRYHKLFAGLAVPRPGWVPTGNVGGEHIAREDTPDQDYGELLERAYALVVACQPSAGSNPESAPEGRPARVLRLVRSIQQLPAETRNRLRTLTEPLHDLRKMAR